MVTGQLPDGWTMPTFRAVCAPIKLGGIPRAQFTCAWTAAAMITLFAAKPLGLAACLAMFFVLWTLFFGVCRALYALDPYWWENLFLRFPVYMRDE
jgi:hypothetical protein